MRSSNRRDFLQLGVTLLSVRAARSSAADGLLPTSGAPELHQFDFLVGLWRLSGEVKVSGLVELIHGRPKLAGSWKAWHAADGRGIEDELTLTDASGNPVADLHAKRLYSPTERCWKITGLGAEGEPAHVSIARWQNGEMISLGSATDHQGAPYQNRTRFNAIAPTSFRMTQDHSYDDGKTWDNAVVTIDARRVGAAPT